MHQARPTQGPNAMPSPNKQNKERLEKTREEEKGKNKKKSYREEALLLPSTLRLNSSSPSIPRNAIRPFPRNTSHTISALTSYPLFFQRRFSQLVNASALHPHRRSSHARRMTSTMPASMPGSIVDCKGTEERGRGSARGGNVASYAVRKCRSLCSVWGGDVRVRPKGWPLSLRADSGHAAVG